MQKNFIKENLVLIMGLALPLLLMIVFMASTMFPLGPNNPPKYSMVFSSQDYYSGNNNSPLSVNFVVKEGILKAQFTRNPANSYYGWRKLYLFDAETKKVRDLSFGLPADVDAIKTTREDLVEATKDMKLDTNLQAPDGYELSYDGYSRSGLFNDIFWNGGSRETRLRNGNSSIKLMGSDTNMNFYYGNVQFIGWVVK